MVREEVGEDDGGGGGEAVFVSSMVPPWQWKASAVAANDFFAAYARGASRSGGAERQRRRQTSATPHAWHARSTSGWTRSATDGSRTTTDALLHMSTAHERPIQPSGEAATRPAAAASRRRRERGGAAERQRPGRRPRAPRAHVALEPARRADRPVECDARAARSLSTLEEAGVKPRRPSPTSGATWRATR